MRLDDGRRPLERNRLDHVGIERALAEEFRAADFLRFVLEHVDEGVADDAPLLLGIEHAGEALEKQVGSVGHAERDSEPPGEDRLHPLALSGAQEAGIDEDAFETVANRAMDEHGGDRRIDAAR